MARSECRRRAARQPGAGRNRRETVCPTAVLLRQLSGEFSAIVYKRFDFFAVLCYIES